MLNCPPSTVDFRSNEGAVMQFGLTIKPDMTVERIVSLTRQAEAAGLNTAGSSTRTSCGWSRIRCSPSWPPTQRRCGLGTCVTNPATRDITVTSSLFATLNLISGGRMDLASDAATVRDACSQEAG